jgi:hypothetical protein
VFACSVKDDSKGRTYFRKTLALLQIAIAFQYLVHLSYPLLRVGTISPAELKKLRRCGSFYLSGPIIYKRL